MNDNSYWLYGYDALGQVTNANKFWADNSVVPGEQFGNAFDDIGNRTGTTQGGDARGGSLRSAFYNVNSVNEYTGRSVPNAFDVLGQANAGASVLVNGTPVAYRRGEFYQTVFTVTNSSGPVWVTVTNTATNNGAYSNVVGNWFVPKNPEYPMRYDADGNLTNDGRFAYTWDAENRLLMLSNIANIPASGQFVVKFSYDYQGRRIQKLVLTNTGSGWVASYTNKFLYDGWNVIAVLDANNSLLQSFAWGSDLSGTIQGAGGVGGLISTTIPGGANAGTYFCCYDGNGNVIALVNASSGTIAAQYEYGPFGEVIRATGPMAKVNPFRFSTKYQDDETDFLYYGYRYYNASTGRWPSRDPIGEKGGLDLYCFVNNSPEMFFDALGLATTKVVQCGGKCGAVVDDWVNDEIKAQEAGWDAFKQKNKNPTTYDYSTWANGNQRYKDSGFFAFNKGTQCGTKASGAEVGCGFSVTLCGSCVRSAILGNIMFGVVGSYAGFSEKDLQDEVNKLKGYGGGTVDPNDATAYQFGFDLQAQLKNGGDFCKIFNQLLSKSPGVLHEGRSDGGYNDLSSCGACSEKTKETRHGGKEGTRLRP